MNSPILIHHLGGIYDQSHNTKCKPILLNPIYLDEMSLLHLSLSFTHIAILLKFFDRDIGFHTFTNEAKRMRKAKI